MRRFNWHSVAALGVTTLGVLASPLVLAVLPAKIAACVAIAGAIYQSATGKALPKPGAADVARN